ncbi:MAG: tetratricopeptide repeat protein, partial [Phycisphaerales bacterium]|nr:tetratricopeptide repeat protein [Phycisphaerales bacterium]
MTSRARLYASSGVLLALLSAGCESPGFRAAKAQSEERWQAARAKVKAQLAADQLESGNITAAAVELAEATRQDPDNQELIPLRAKVHLAAGELNQAQRALESGYGPDSSPEIDYLLGVVWQQRERWDAALECFERAARKAPREVA